MTGLTAEVPSLGGSTALVAVSATLATAGAAAAHSGLQLMMAAAKGGGGQGGGTSTSPGPRVTNPSKSESKVWQNLQNYRSGIKTSGGGSSVRYYTWDNLHNEIEVFNKQGNHLGVIDPTTGEFIKPPVPGRTLDL